MGLLFHSSPQVRARWGILSLLVLLSLVAAPPRQVFAQAETESAETEEADDDAAEEEDADESDEDATGDDSDDDEAPAPAPPPTLESVAKSATDAATAATSAAMAGNTAWMLTSSALVLFMTAPGLAMFYGGLVRKKNVLGVMMQCVTLMGLMTVLWALIGYSLAFGGTNKDLGEPNPYFGDLDYLFMKNVARSWPDDSDEAESDEAESDEAILASDKIGNLVEPMTGAISTINHMLFQGMFFIITPGLICGAFAERMKFSTMVVFSILWGLLIYCPLCHWVWGGGILAFARTADLETTSSLAGGALDFAGGTVVHISSGVSALVCALLIGKRKGFGHEDMRPHNLTYTVLGAAMLWVGWFGFNAGSELMSDHLATSAFATTHFAAAAGMLGWMLYDWLVTGKPTVLGAASGLVAGLVCITPGAGFVNLMPALAIGFSAGIICALACGKLKPKMGYDDSLDAFGVHGVGGTLGALLTGVFATRAAWNIDTIKVGEEVVGGYKLGLIEGETRVFIGQIVAVAVTWVFSLVGTFIILKVLDGAMGLRVPETDEVRGLDVTQHGEEGYIFV
jgi:ammonium transporter, Amt family